MWQKNNTFLRRISCLIFSLFPKCLCPCDLSIDSVHFRFMSEKKAILAYNKDFDRKTEQKRMSLCSVAKNVTTESESAQLQAYKLVMLMN